MFKCRESMTKSQQKIADEFMNMIEDEYAFCVKKMRQADKAAYRKEIPADSELPVGAIAACREIDAIRGYWHKRLLSLVEVMEWRNPRLLEELANKYLKDE